MIKKIIKCLGMMALCIGIAGCGNDMQSKASVDSADIENGIMYTESETMAAGADIMMDAAASESLSLSGSTTQNVDGTSAGTSDGTSAGASDKQVLSQEKMIYRTYLNEETLDFDEAYSQVKELLTRNNCIIANENIANNGNSYMSSGYHNSRNGYVTEREAYIEIRVPVENYNSLLESILAVGNVISKESTATNITRSYYDTKAEMEAYEEEYVQLQKLMEMAQDMEDILVISSQMTSVRSQINRLRSSLQNMDTDVAYSYVYLTLTEVVEYTQPETTRVRKTFVDRLKNTIADSARGFLGFCEGLLFLVITLLPYAVVVAIIVLIYRKTPLHRRRKENKDRKKAEKAGQNQNVTKE